jgi:ATP-dependent 26S proteasome regulatory subunit
MSESTTTAQPDVEEGDLQSIHAFMVPGSTGPAAIRPTASATYQRAEEHLRDYLHLVLLALKRYVARHAHRMLQANGTLSNLYVSVAEAGALLTGEAGEAPPNVSEQLGWPSEAAVEAELKAHRKAMTVRAKRSAKEGFKSPIHGLRELVQLTERQVVLLLAAAAPLVSVDLARLFAFAWADFSVKQPSVGFLTELFADDPAETTELVREFYGDSPLVRYRLVELGDVGSWGHPTPLLHQAVRVPDEVVAYIQGHQVPLSRRIADACRLVGADEVLPEEKLVLAERTASSLRVALYEAVSSPRHRPRLVLVGGDGSGRGTAVTSLLARRGWGVVQAQLGALTHDPATFEQCLIEVCREAMLRRCVLLVRGDGIFIDRQATEAILPQLGRVLNNHRGPLALTATRPVPMLHHAIHGTFEVPFEVPSAGQQRQLWKRAITQAGCNTRDDVPAILTQRFSVSPGTIFRAVEEARSRAALFAKPGQRLELRVNDLAQAIRRRTDHLLGSIAQPFSTTLTWDDVVLPDKLIKNLKEILSYARNAEMVYEAWGFRKKMPYGRGISCLFAGPPGTGKTMMAAIMAKALGRELYRVDLSRVVSKWVGETEKNLSVAFDEAERGQLMLLFDEADSLFSKRTKTKSATDRFANMEINYLLQRMENFDGVTILTTNNEKAIDEAFKRRLKFKLGFPMPDPELREKLWRTMIPEEAKIDSDIPFDYLGKKFELSGGNIRNAVLRAAFAAAENDGLINYDRLYDAAVAEAREMGMVVREDMGAD